MLSPRANLVYSSIVNALRDVSVYLHFVPFFFSLFPLLIILLKLSHPVSYFIIFMLLVAII